VASADAYDVFLCFGSFEQLPSPQASSRGLNEAGYREQPATEEIVRVDGTGKRKEEAAANRLNVLFERLTVEPPLNRNETSFQIRLIGNEQQSLIELTGLRYAIRVVERATQDQVFLRFCRA
jgi:hypothetical protein